MCGTKKIRQLFGKLAEMFKGKSGGENIYTLPENAPELETALYVNDRDREDEYASIIYDGREYVCFGTIDESIGERDVEACVGYTGGSRSNVVCTLKETNDYIMRTFLQGFMDQPMFFRAADTLGKEIYTPGYIRDWGYGLWDARKSA